MPMTALNFLSPDGKCYTFDARANGYGRGEGIGIVVLKRLQDAIRDNDNIRAVIRGSSVNQDGRTPGMYILSHNACYSNFRLQVSPYPARKLNCATLSRYTEEQVFQSTTRRMSNATAPGPRPATGESLRQCQTRSARGAAQITLYTLAR